ncbi:MAG: recombinase family protein [Bacteroidetes bacterium]|nr:recombinase family protein [Bacteroidota bacterium]
MTKVIFYIRCSTLEQEPDLQINDIKTICELPFEIYKENQSAWAENVVRPVFSSIVSLIKKRKVTDLYVWDLDRIYRNRKRLQEFFILCKTYDCKVHSYRQNWLEDINSIPAPFNEIVFDLLINITGWMGQDESQKKSERVRMAVKKRNNGTFSYKGNKWGRKALPKQTIDRVLEFHQQGKSIREIASLVKIYDKNNNGKQISKSAVHKILVENSTEKDS